MELFITNADATVIKNILITTENLKVSDENYKTKAIFLEKLAATKKGILDTQHVIEYVKITKIIPFENENAIQLFFVEKDKNQKTYIELNTSEEYNEVLQLITDTTTHLTLETAINTPFGSWIKQAGYTLIALALTVAIAFLASDIEANETIEISGSKRGLKRIMVSIAETLGTVNSIIIGSIVVLGFVFWTFRSHRKGKGEVKVYK